MQLQYLALALPWIYGSSIWAHPFAQSKLANSSVGVFDWSALTPCDELKWTKCYEQQECARLQVPLDWQNPDNGRKATLAVIRLPATVDRTDPSFGGSILLNPGGPGESGINFVRWGGLEIQSNIDNDKNFEIVSWDPRGVGHTLPSASCFDSDLNRQTLAYKVAAIGNAGDSDASLKDRLAAAEAFGDACQTNSNLEYMSTLFDAHDMVTLIDALDPDTKEPLLNFWGFSYGSHLGNTFASVFPKRIGRMVLDGVVDAEDYTEAHGLGNMGDIDKVLEFFYETCWQAGDKCVISDENLANVKLKVEAFLAKMLYEPTPVYADGRADILQYSDVISFMRATMYYPVQNFPDLALGLGVLMEGNTTAAASLAPMITDPNSETPAPVIKPSNHSWDNPLLPSYPWYDEVTRAVTCGDGDDISNRTFAEQLVWVNKIKAQSKYFGAQWANQITWCARYPSNLRPEKGARFTGPFGSKSADYNAKAAPLLFIGNLADPATPIANARKMSALHEGSEVLEVLQYGHTSGPLNPSACVYSHVSEYFNSGTLPPSGQTCQPDQIPFQESTPST